MIARSFVTKDFDLLKEFLYQLSIGSMTFAEGDKQWKNPTRNRINEICVYYENNTGCVSFAIHLSDTKGNGKEVRHFKNVFQNLNALFKDQKVLLYICFESIFGSAITVEYLGSCTFCPINGIEQKLANKTRFLLTTLRAQSALQKISKFALQCSTGYYCLNYFYPLLSRSRLFGNELNILDVNRLIQLYRDLGLNGPVEQTNAHKHRLRLAKNFPCKKIHIFSHDLKYLHYLSYYAFYFLDGRFPNENSIVCNREMQTD